MGACRIAGPLTAGFTIYVDTREKYAFRFARRDVTLVEQANAAGDYSVRDGERWLAAVERKSIEDLIKCLSDGSLVFQLQAMAELPLAAVVVEGRYPKLFDVPRVKEGWLPDVLARPQIRYREIPFMFADSRKFAEEWTYRSLAGAIADLTDVDTAELGSDQPQNGMSSAASHTPSEDSDISTHRSSSR